jgi:hypothetical protein
MSSIIPVWAGIDAQEDLRGVGQEGEGAGGVTEGRVVH